MIINQTINTPEISRNREAGTALVSCDKSRAFLLEDCQMPKTHGLSRVNGKDSKLYKVWSQMKNRCKNPNSPRFKYYGAMGVTVCEEWFDFPVFHQWAMEAGYRHGLTIDRKDANGNYEPENCRWIPMGAQTLNHRFKKGKGLYWEKRKQRWRARIQLNGKQKCRYFKNHEDAIRYIEAERERLFNQTFKLIVDPGFKEMEESCDGIPGIS